MKNLNTHKLYFFFASVLMLITGCERDLDDDLPLATYPTTAEIFTDTPVGLGSDFYFPYNGAKPTAWSVDNSQGYDSSASMRIDVPNANDPEGGYAGGILRIEGAGRDLSGYDALTFYAKASQAVSIAELGFGEDFGDNKYITTLYGADLTTNWKKFIIPIPDASKLIQERGVFRFAASGIGAQGQEVGYTFWIDELKFENLGTVAQPRPKIMNGANETVSGVNGSTFSVSGLTETFNLANGQDVTVGVAPAYYTFVSSNPSVATVDDKGKGTILSEGTAVITASLGGVEAQGSLTIGSNGNFVHAPTPTLPASDVISVFSDAYNNINVDYFNGYWGGSTTQTEDLNIEGDEIKYYTNLNYVGIEFQNPPVDASAMTHLHLDVLTDEQISGSFTIKIRDRGANGTVDSDFNGNPTEDDAETVYSVSAGGLNEGDWSSIDIPLASGGLANQRNNVVQVVFVGGISNFYLDNVYFYTSDDGGTTPTEPTTAAPTPTLGQENVISLFSDAYTDVTVDTWRTDWSAADLEEVTIEGNATKKYTNLSFVGVETVANTIDASEMTHIHLDIWTPNASAFGVKLVDFGADGAYDGGDDVEHQIDFTSIAQGEWISYDIPLSDFTGLTTKGHLAQYIFVAQPSGNATVYIDNIYFHN